MNQEDVTNQNLLNYNETGDNEGDDSTTLLVPSNDNSKNNDIANSERNINSQYNEREHVDTNNDNESTDDTLSEIQQKLQNDSTKNWLRILSLVVVCTLF